MGHLLVAIWTVNSKEYSNNMVVASNAADLHTNFTGFDEFSHFNL